MGRMLRRLAPFVAMLVLAFATTSCIFLDSERRSNFRGPTWDVPLTIPLAAKETMRIADVFDFEIGEDGALGFAKTLDEMSFDVPPGWQTPDFKTEPQVLDVDLGEWPDTDELAFLDVILSIDIGNDAGFKGSLKIQIDGLSEEGTITDSKSRDVSLGRTGPVDFNVTELVNVKPDRLRITWSAKLDAGPGLIPGGTIAISPEVWVPLVLHIGGDGESFPLAEAVPLNLDEQSRSTLSTAPVSSVTIALDVDTRLPFAFQLDVAFTDTSAGTEPVIVSAFMPPASTDDRGRAVDALAHTVELVIDESVRRALLRDGAMAEATMTLFSAAPSGRIRLQQDDYVAWKAYATIAARVNKGADVR